MRLCTWPLYKNVVLSSHLSSSGIITGSFAIPYHHKWSKIVQYTTAPSEECISISVVYARCMPRYLGSVRPALDIEFIAEVPLVLRYGRAVLII